MIVILVDNELVITDLYFKSFNYYTTLDNISVLFSVICFLLFLNAINMFDGINMQVAMYSFFVLFIIAISSKLIFIIIPFLICLVAILILNYQNKLFLGDSGALLIAYLIAYFIVKMHNHFEIIQPEEIFLLMMIPGIDMFRLFIVRIINNKNPFLPDNKHLHHLLLENMGYFKSLILIQTIIILPNLLYYFEFLNIMNGIILSLIMYFLLNLNFLWIRKK